MIKIAEVFSPQQNRLSKMVKQCGVDHVVGGINLNPIPNASREEQPWSYKSLARARAAYEDAGFKIGDRCKSDRALMGLCGIFLTKNLPKDEEEYNLST